MRKIKIALYLGILYSSLAAAGKPNVGESVAPNPASQQWVLQQLQVLQQQMDSKIAEAVAAAAAGGGAGSVLAESDWLSLCPANQSLDTSSGCTPNCQGEQSAACTKLLSITEMEDQSLISSTAPTGLSVFRLTVLTSFTDNSPLIANNSSNNNVRCQMYTLRGTLLNNLNDNFLLGASSVATLFQQYTSGMDLGINSNGRTTQVLSNAPSAGAQRSNQQYYLVCMSYTIANNITTNANMDGTLNVSWS